MVIEFNNVTTFFYSHLLVPRQQKPLQLAVTCIILAGGTGSRLYPLTKITNKVTTPTIGKCLCGSRSSDRLGWGSLEQYKKKNDILFPYSKILPKKNPH
ncbi:MAG: hypothetical protein E4G94_06440 [ANME-2 cluster archaeon]|nr:MAG: hypothetical protein E4G94_06440 [ANME-2 cluster archaeon]